MHLPNWIKLLVANWLQHSLLETGWNLVKQIKSLLQSALLDHLKNSTVDPVLKYELTRLHPNENWIIPQTLSPRLIWFEVKENCIDQFPLVVRMQEVSAHRLNHFQKLMKPLWAECILNLLLLVEWQVRSQWCEQVVEARLSITKLVNLWNKRL